ncbi:MBL fold metallo-hydrolase [Rhodocyclaceae bacterium SMB388]
MKFTQIRNATITLGYAGKKFLIDPMLADKGAYPGFEGTVNSHLANPTVGLPVTISEILDVDAAIVTHTHPDHWDEAARQLLPNDMIIFAQNDEDACEIRSGGFTNVRVLQDRNEFDGITMIKTAGQHGRGEILQGPIGEILGQVCGLVFKHPDEKTFYLAGDTVWYEGVNESLQKHVPEVIVLNSGDARVLPDESIIMGKEDIFEVFNATAGATIIASHMESVNHATLSRKELREFLDAKNMGHRVLVPEDGESCIF